VELAAPLLWGLAPGILDSDAAYGLGRGGEEMALAVPLASRSTAKQPQVSLVHQGWGLERMTRWLVRQPLGCQAPEFVNDQGQQLLGRVGIATLDSREDLYDLAHRRSRQWPSPRSIAPHPSHVAPSPGAMTGVVVGPRLDTLIGYRPNAE
jgi:hypothetical protein